MTYSGKRSVPLLPGVYLVPYPYPYRNRTGPGDAATLDYVFNFIDEMLDTRVPPRNIAAFIVEPVLGEGGYVVPPAGFLPRARELCAGHGIPLFPRQGPPGHGRHRPLSPRRRAGGGP